MSEREHCEQVATMHLAREFGDLASHIDEQRLAGAFEREREAARAEGYRAGVEDAATVATGMPFAPGALGVIAEAIRALAKESK